MFMFYSRILEKHAGLLTSAHLDFTICFRFLPILNNILSSIFTKVCTTELGAAASLEPDFDKRNVKVCGFSCNDVSSHIEWINDIKVATGFQVNFPLFCDPDRAHATSLGILDETNKNAKGLPMTVRSVYILKPNKQIALMMTYPASSGRNFDEVSC